MPREICLSDRTEKDRENIIRIDNEVSCFRKRRKGDNVVPAIFNLGEINVLSLSENTIRINKLND